MSKTEQPVCAYHNTQNNDIKECKRKINHLILMQGAMLIELLAIFGGII